MPRARARGRMWRKRREARDSLGCGEDGGRTALALPRVPSRRCTGPGAIGSVLRPCVCRLTTGTPPCCLIACTLPLQARQGKAHSPAGCSRGRGPRWPEQDLHPPMGPAAARPGVKMGHYLMASSPGTTFRGAGGRPSQTTSLPPCASAVSSTCPPGGSSVGLAMSGQSFSGLSHFCRN